VFNKRTKAPGADLHEEPAGGTIAGWVGTTAAAAAAVAAEPPPPSAPAQGIPEGSLDVVSATEIGGWAWNPADPSEHVVVEILDGDEVILSVYADRPREDLRQAGVGDGRYGFSIPNPGALLQNSRHIISARRALDKLVLSGSPMALERAERGLDPAAMSFIENAMRTGVASASSASDVDLLLSQLVRVFDLVIQGRQEAEAKKPGGGRVNVHEALEGADLSFWTRELVVKMEHDYAPLQFEEVEDPKVSVIIPVYNKFSVTYDCLKSIAANLPQHSFEIIVVDDCSRDETMFASFAISGVRFVRNQKNLGFVGGCNAGAQAARGEYLFFLNNDTLVKPGWLDELVETFESVPNIGIAGSKLLFGNGSLQEVGGIIWRLGDGWNYGRGGDSADPRYCYLRDADYVSGAALMIPRKLFESLDGFDKLFIPAYYEDTDLCFRVRAAGYRVVVQPASEIVHLEGVSAGTDVQGSGMKRYQLINHRKFYQRWKDILATHRFNGEQPELEAERTTRKVACFIDDSVPTPDQDAGSNAALQHMLALIRLGYKVVFLPADNMARIDPYTCNLQKLGIECLYAPYFWSVEEIFRKKRIHPDVVYLHRYSNASKYSNLVRQHFPDCRILYNVADLHFLRQERELEVEGKVSGGSRVTADLELAAMRQSHSIIVHSAVEAGILRERDPSLQVFVVPWTVTPEPCQTPFAERSGFAFVGGYRHRPNVDAALFLARDILPQVARKLPGIKGYLVGSNAPPEVQGLESEHLRVLGFVPDLGNLLHRLRCTVAPLRYGAGLKGKVLDSLAHGIPCVMSEVAAEGVGLSGELEWLVARSTSEFCDKLAQLCEDQEQNARMAELGLAHITGSYGPEAVKQLLARTIEAAAP
jgi:O-antigen biosynthesis protein